MRWIVIFGLACVAAVAAIIVRLWAFGWTDDLGPGAHGFVALGIGVILSVGLGVALMALIFHSSRSGHDEVITIHMGDTRPD